MNEKSFNQREQGNALFFYWTRVSPRLVKVWEEEDSQLFDWIHDHFSNRVLSDGLQFDQVVKAIGERVAILNRSRIGSGPYYNMEAVAPTSLAMGHIHIGQTSARHRCIHLSVGLTRGYIGAS